MSKTKKKGSITIINDNLKKKYKKKSNSPFFSNYKKKELFIGKECVEIVKKQKPMDIFYRYFQNIMDNTYGFLIFKNMTNCADVCNKVSEILTYIFKSILDYNKIQTYSDILIGESYSSVIVGEPIIYMMDKKSCKLKLFFFMPCIANILASSTNYSVRFSDDIKNSCFKDSLSMIFENQHLYQTINDHDIELQNLILKLFIISDHSATHFMEEYKTCNTDWINHHNFGQILKGQIITYNTIFNISATIKANVPKPIIITGGRGGEGRNLNQEFMFNELTVSPKYYVRPLQTIQNNIANLMPLEY